MGSGPTLMTSHYLDHLQSTYFPVRPPSQVPGPRLQHIFFEGEGGTIETPEIGAHARTHVCKGTPARLEGLPRSTGEPATLPTHFISRTQLSSSPEAFYASPLPPKPGCKAGITVHHLARHPLFCTPASFLYLGSATKSHRPAHRRRVGGSARDMLAVT